MKRVAIAVVGLLWVLSGSAHAWELDTHVGLTARAVQRSELDAWLRQQGFDNGLQELISLRSGGPNEHQLLEQLAPLDAALGVTPDNARQTALDWLLAGAALEGLGIDRLRHHFLDANAHGLDERDRLASWRVRFDDVRAGLGSVRGALTGVNFDGSGMRADRWIVSPDNELSRMALLDAQAEAQRAAAPAQREAAIVHALVCTGAIMHVLEAMGDPAFVRNDFVTNQLLAGAPLERFASKRYGLLVPPASTATPPAHRTLESFFRAGDGSAIAEEIARTYKSPATLASPYTTTQLAATADALLPRIGAEAAALLNFLVRGSLELAPRTDDNVTTIALRNGRVVLGVGRLELYGEDDSGKRTRILERDIEGAAAGAELARFGNELPSSAHKIIALYRGVDGAAEPIVVAATLAR